MRGQEVDRRPGRPAALVEEVAAAGEPGGEVLDLALVALPERPDVVAVAVVPLGPAGREAADLVAAGAAVPRLGDHLHLAQHRVLPDRAQEAAFLVEAVGLARQDGAEVEAEPVDVHLGHPVAQAVHHHLDHARVGQVERVPRPGVVDVVALLVGQQPVVAGVVDALERQRRPFLVAFAGVVVDHVQDHLEPGLVEAADHLLELGEREVRHGGVAAAGGEEREGGVAPVVHQALLDQVAVVGEHVDRQQLHAGDAEVLDVAHHLGRGQAAERAAQLLRHGRVQLGEALHVRLVQHRPVPRHARRPVVAPGEGRVDHAALGHERGAVALVEGRVVLTHDVAEQLRRPVDLAHHGLGVGVQHQLVRVEAVPVLRLIGSVHAVAVDGAGPGLGQEAVPDLVGVFRQVDAADLGLARIVEQAQLHLGGIGGEQREVDPQPGPGRALRERTAFLDA